MPHHLLGAILICAAVGVAWLTPAPARADAAQTEAAAVHPAAIPSLLPSVVSIAVVRHIADSADPSKPPRRKDTVGSGFIVDPSGIIVTNRHVIDGAATIHVILEDKTRLKATPVFESGQIDLALLKVQARHPLPAVKFGDSDTVQVGDDAIAIGNPLGLGGTVTAGVISALNRDILGTPFDHFFQTDTVINHGNSGGPLFNLKGEVIGINTAIYETAPDSGYIGLGFALPGNDAKVVVQQFRQFGRVRAGWLGARLQEVTSDLADAFGLATTQGALVAATDPDGPADKAGIREGDVIVQFGDIRPADPQALSRAVLSAAIGRPAPIVVRRGTGEQTMMVSVSEWPASLAVAARPAAAAVAHSDPPDAGLQVQALSDKIRAQYRLGNGVKGVVVSDVVAGSPAADATLRAGDVIAKVQREAVNDPVEFSRRLADARRDRHNSVALLVVRETSPRWIALPLGDSDQ